LLDYIGKTDELVQNRISRKMKKLWGDILNNLFADLKLKSKFRYGIKNETYFLI